VQVYVTRPASPGRARRRLGGFARVEVAAGAAAEVTVRVPLRSLALRDVGTHSWVLPAGAYRFEVAHDAGDPAPLGVTLHLDEAHWSR
jgi:beta-glucosidase